MLRSLFGKRIAPAAEARVFFYCSLKIKTKMLSKILSVMLFAIALLGAVLSGDRAASYSHEQKLVSGWGTYTALEDGKNVYAEVSSGGCWKVIAAEYSTPGWFFRTGNMTKLTIVNSVSGIILRFELQKLTVSSPNMRTILGEEYAVLVWGKSTNARLSILVSQGPLKGLRVETYVYGLPDRQKEDIQFLQEYCP